MLGLAATDVDLVIMELIAVETLTEIQTVSNSHMPSRKKAQERNHFATLHIRLVHYGHMNNGAEATILNLTGTRRHERYTEYGPCLSQL